MVWEDGGGDPASYPIGVAIGSLTNAADNGVSMQFFSDEREQNLVGWGREGQRLFD